jgi:hypothetical protein
LSWKQLGNACGSRHTAIDHQLAIRSLSHFQYWHADHRLAKLGDMSSELGYISTSVAAWRQPQSARIDVTKPATWHSRYLQ